jgi:hypothetical protein
LLVVKIYLPVLATLLQKNKERKMKKILVVLVFIYSSCNVSAMNYPLFANSNFYSNAASMVRNIAQKENTAELKNITDKELSKSILNIRKIFRLDFDALSIQEKEQWLDRNNITDSDLTIALLMSRLIKNNIATHEIFEALLLRAS